MARVWNNVTNLENLSNRTILQLLQNQNELLQEFAKQIEQIEGIANTAVGTANNALNIANSANTKADSAISTANAASSAASQAVQTANATEDKVLEYEPQVDGAVTAANEAKTAANEAKTAANSAVGTAGAANQSANQALSQVADLSDDVETNATNIQTAQEDITAIEGREAGYGKSLAISGNSLSLMHDATTLHTVTLPGGGGGAEITIHSLEGWSCNGLAITGAYAIELNNDIWYIFGKILHAPVLNGNTAVTITPPSDWGTVTAANGWVSVGKAASYSRTLSIINGPSGVSTSTIGVVEAPATPGGQVNYVNESLYTFALVVSKAAI